MVRVLQFVYGHLVHFGDRSEGLTACDDVRICARKWRRSSCGGSGRASCRGRAFSNHYAWANMRDLLFQLEDLLRKRVNLRILFVHLFYQRFELYSIIRFVSLRRRRLTRPSAKQPQEEYRTTNRYELHRGKTLPSAHLSGKHHQRSE